MSNDYQEFLAFQAAKANANKNKSVKKKPAKKKQTTKSSGFTGKDALAVVFVCIILYFLGKMGVLTAILQELALS